MTDYEEKVADVVWQEPPKEEKVRYDWPKIAEQLRSRPMEWGKIFDDDRTSTVNAIRQGSVAPVHPNLGFEVLTTNNVREPKRRCTLFLRYNPDRDQTKE